MFCHFFTNLVIFGGDSAGGSDQFVSFLDCLG